jgi:hypothetical protein
VKFPPCSAAMTSYLKHLMRVLPPSFSITRLSVSGDDSGPHGWLDI